MVSCSLSHSFGPATLNHRRPTIVSRYRYRQHFEFDPIFKTQPVKIDKCRGDVVRAFGLRDQAPGVGQDAL